MIKNPFRSEDDQAFPKLTNYAMGQSTPAQNQPTQQSSQYAQASTLTKPAQQQSSQPQQPAPQVAPQPAPVVPPAPQAQQFGQPQQPQPVQPRQTTMTQNTAAQRYNQMIQQNVPQAQAVSSGLAQVIEDPVTQAKRKMDAAQTEFRQRVAESGLTRDVGRTSELINKAAALKAGETLTPQEFAELENISKTKGKFGEGIRDTDFVALQNYVQALGEAEKAKQMAGLTETAGERQELLSKLVGDQAYSEGQSLYDALLAGGVQPAAQQLGDIRQRLITENVLGKQATEQQQRAAAARQLEQEEIESAYKDIQDMLDAGGTGKLAAQEKAIRDRVIAENKRVQDLNKEIDTVLKDRGAVFGDTDPEKALISKLGLTTKQVSKINKGGSAAQDIITRLKEVNEQGVTSADELAKLNALYKIGGLVNRQGDKIVAQEGEDLGALANQKAVLDKAALERATGETDQLVKSLQDANYNELTTRKVKGYGSSDGKLNKNANLMDATSEIHRKMSGGAFRPHENKEADKVIKELLKLQNESAKKQAELGRPITYQETPDDKLIEKYFLKIRPSLGYFGLEKRIKNLGDLRNAMKNNKRLKSAYDQAYKTAQIELLSKNIDPRLHERLINK